MASEGDKENAVPLSNLDSQSPTHSSIDPALVAPKKKGKKRNGKESQGPPQVLKAVWSSSDDAVLVQTLVNERAQGRQSDNGFKSAAYTACALALEGSEKVSGGIPKTSKSCSDHWAKLKKDYGMVKTLREKSGFGWDDTTKTVTAPPDVWSEYLKKAPKGMHIWMTKAFPLYDECAILVDGAVATGEVAFRAGQVFDDTTLSDSGKDDSASQADDEDDKEQETVETPPKSSRKRRASSTPPPSGKRRRPGGKPSATTAFINFSNGFQSVVEAMNAPPPGSGPSSPERRRAAIRLMEDDGELSEHEQVSALKIFSRNTAVADSFTSISKKSTRTHYIHSEIEASSF